jgi:hypothetical protein
LHGAVAGAVRGYLDADGSPLTIEKGRGWLCWFETIEAALGEPPRVILPVRDLRGIASSIERRYRANPQLAGHGGGAATVGGRVQHWFAPNVAPVGPALASLQDALRRGVVARCLVVRYEDLASDPLTELARVYRFLGYQMLPGVHDVESVHADNREHDAVHGPFGDHEIAAGPVQYTEPSWDTVLGSGLAQAIVDNNAWFYQAFYPPNTDTTEAPALEEVR